MHYHPPGHPDLHAEPLRRFSTPANQSDAKTKLVRTPKMKITDKMFPSSYRCVTGRWCLPSHTPVTYLPTGGTPEHHIV